jgi:hypothetical protein
VREASIDYDRHAETYSRRRRADPRIAARLHAALADARTVVNVGAGTGSYEPEDRYVLAGFWMLSDYLPEALADDRQRFLPIDAITPILGEARIESIPIPANCTDGFFEAHYARPEAYLDPAVRGAQSVWPRLPEGAEQRAVAALAADIASGAWDARHGHLRTQAEYDGGLRLIVA